ncbi:MAG: squalene/phytoene synthase family protein, partial [Alphaproteobacteria bacterium]|nr:squalene/phytoene synthase family protein [Alphaproteobacteria bacterium]
LDLYIDRVAVAVGRMSNRILGLEGPDAGRLAHHLGAALQLTNILRDVEEDAARGRLYVPRTLLARHGVSGEGIGELLRHPDFGAALADLAVLAREHFAAAQEAIRGLDRRVGMRARTRAPRIMWGVYLRLLDRLERRGLARIDEPVRLGAAEKLWLAVRHGWLG